MDVMKNLREVVLDSNAIEGDVGNAFGMARRLEYLSISHNRLTRLPNLNVAQNSLRELHAADNDIQELSQFGRGYQTLHELDLSLNTSLRLTKSSFSKSVRRTLQVLKLDECHIEGLSAWGKPFKALTQLHLQKNGISDLSLIPSLFPNIHILNLKHNKIASIEALKPLQKLSHSFSVLKVAGNPLCSEPDYAEQIHKLFPHLNMVDDTHYDVEFSILEKKEQELFDDMNLDFSMPLKTLKHQMDRKEQREQQTHDGKKADEVEVLDPATEKFLKQLNTKQDSKYKKVANPADEFFIPHDEARALYEDCQKAQDVVEQRFKDLDVFMSTPYENIHFDKSQNKISVTRTTTMKPDEIRNISRPSSAAVGASRPSSVASSIASFDEYFKPSGALDLELDSDHSDSSREEGAESVSDSGMRTSAGHKLKRRFKEAQAFSTQMTQEGEEFNHQKLFESTGLNRQRTTTSDQILKELNIPTAKTAAKKKVAPPSTKVVKSGSRRFRVPKHMMAKVEEDQKKENEEG